MTGCNGGLHWRAAMVGCNGGHRRLIEALVIERRAIDLYL